jgi:uncharacterized membrane protein
LTDPKIELISSALFLIGIIVTIVHFNKNQSNQLNILEKQIQSQREENQEINLSNFQNSFWKRQLELYIQSSSSAAELTQSELNSEKHRESRQRFYTLFWGPMSIVEDISVKKVMENYSSQLIKYEISKSKDDLELLQQKSFELARTCRESSIKRWELKEFE